MPIAEETPLGRLTASELSEARPFVDGQRDDGPPLPALERLRAMADTVRSQELNDASRLYTIRVDVTTGEVTALAVPRASLAIWAKTVAPTGIASASEVAAKLTTATPPGVPPGVRTQSWSASADNRVLRNSASQDSDPVLSKVGLITINGSGACTGTMFSRQHVFTAAHCVLNSSGVGNWMTFAPRQRGAVQPYGTSTADVWYAATAWLSKSCYNSAAAASDCYRYDWAILHFPPTFSPNPGYVAFGYLNDTEIGAAYNMTAGYPGCGYAASPAGCSFPNQYQDTGCNTVHSLPTDGSTSNWWPYNDGTKSRISIGCDFNEGQSGSGIFRLSDDVMFGNWTNNYGGCYTNCTTYGGTGNRISPELFYYMLTFRNQAP